MNFVKNYSNRIRNNSVLILIGICFLLTSCRFGNYVEAPAKQNNQASNSDTISGFYTTSPRSLKFFATRKTLNTNEAQAGLTLIPSEIGVTFSNPVAFILDKDAPGTALIATDKGKYPLPIFIGKDNQLAASWSNSPQTLWDDPSCTTLQEVEELGTLHPNSNQTPPPQFQHAVSGSLELKIQVISRLRGDCRTSLSKMQACYLNSAQCGADTDAAQQKRQALVNSLFDPLVQLKLIRPDEISNLDNWAYEIWYE